MVLPLKSLGILLIVLCCTSAVCAQQPPRRIPGEFSCCAKADGRRACGDILPSECVGRAHTVYSREGNPIRHVRADDERAILAKQELERQKAQEIEDERNRRREAIMSAYGSLQEIDQQQNRLEAGLKKDIADAEQRISAANKRLIELQAQLPPEGAGGKKTPSIPAELSESINNEIMEAKDQAEFVKLKQQELERVRNKYENDRREYKDLVLGKQ